jgi:membrane fusion protein (multidrug efflux system)
MQQLMYSILIINFKKKPEIYNLMSNKTVAKKAGKNNLRVTLINIVVFLVVAGSLVWIIMNYLHVGNNKYTNDAQIEAYVNPVNTRVSAYIKGIRFNEHQKVKKGDTLVILDNREIFTQLEQAEAGYMNAVAGKGVSTSAVHTIANNVTVMEANMQAAKVRLWNAEQNYKRYESLLRDEAVTRQQFEQMKTEYDAQKAQYLSLANQRKTSGLSVVEANAKIDVNDAEIKRTAAALDMARLNLSYTVITAPYDGVVGRRMVNVGQLLQAGQQVLTLVTDQNKWVTANFRENQMALVKVGKKLSITVDALEGKEYQGMITAISEATGAKYSAVPVDNSTGNFVKVQQRIPVRIEFTNVNQSADLEQLRVGMNVEIMLR